LKAVHLAPYFKKKIAKKARSKLQRAIEHIFGTAVDRHRILVIGVQIEASCEINRPRLSATSVWTKRVLPLLRVASMARTGRS
jgi:hypothetical protein